MTDPTLISSVTIIAVGVDTYSDNLKFRNLNGPKKDIERLYNLLVEDSSTALYTTWQFVKSINPTSNDLRKIINDYIMGRGADNDILIFYFSGHGIAIGRDDFGFCTSDVTIYDRTKSPLPLSVVKVSELLASINIGNIIPIIIIDACYSGGAGASLYIPPGEAISSMKNNVVRVSASSYALLCSCAEGQETKDSSNGGFFSNCLYQIATEGLPKERSNKPLLSLQDIFQDLRVRVQNLQMENSIDSIEITPKLFLGPTLPELPFVKNTQFSVRSYSLSPSYIRILEELWNNGNIRDLDPEEIRSFCGNGAYGNHNKLSFEPWNLVETVPQTKRRRLTERGIQFLNNMISIPKTVVLDPLTNRYIAKEGALSVMYSNYLKHN